MNYSLFLLLLASPAALAQSAKPVPPAEAVQQTVRAFFEGMRRGDSAAVRATLAPGAIFHTITNAQGQPALRPEGPAAFLRAVGTPHQEIWDERIRFEQVLVDDNLASVWTPYEFYRGSVFSHCGYNSFQLVKLATGWRIAHIIDTRRKDKCN